MCVWVCVSAGGVRCVSVWWSVCGGVRSVGVTDVSAYVGGVCGWSVWCGCVDWSLQWSK